MSLIFFKNHLQKKNNCSILVGHVWIKIIWDSFCWHYMKICTEYKTCTKPLRIFKQLEDYSKDNKRMMSQNKYFWRKWPKFLTPSSRTYILLFLFLFINEGPPPEWHCSPTHSCLKSLSTIIRALLHLLHFCSYSPNPSATDF